MRRHILLSLALLTCVNADTDYQKIKDLLFSKKVNIQEFASGLKTDDKIWIDSKRTHIFVAEYVDSNDIYHKPSYIVAKVRDGEWQDGKTRIQEDGDYGLGELK